WCPVADSFSPSAQMHIPVGTSMSRPTAHKAAICNEMASRPAMEPVYLSDRHQTIARTLETGGDPIAGPCALPRRTRCLHVSLHSNRGSLLKRKEKKKTTRPTK